MKNFAAFRLTAWVCFYFAVISMFPPFIDAYIPSAVVCLLTLAASLAAVRFKSAVPRLLLALTPALGLLWARGTVSFVGTALPLIYIVIFLAKGGYDTELWRYRREFRVMAVLAIVIVGLSFVHFQVKLLELDIESLTARIFAPISVLFGALALRARRTGNILSSKWQAGNIGFFVLPLGGVAALALGIRALLPHLGFLKNILMVPIALLAYIWTLLFGMGPQEIQEEEIEYILPESQLWPKLEDMQGGYVDMLTEDTIDKRLFEKPEFLEKITWSNTLIAVLVIVVIVTVVLLLLKAGAARRKDSGEKLELELEKEPPRQRRRSLRFWQRKERGNAAKVREVYREYLELLRTRGVTRYSSETSLEISASAQRVLEGKTDAPLRAVYLKARYGSPAAVTAGDVKLAEDSLRLLTAQEYGG